MRVIFLGGRRSRYLRHAVELDSRSIDAAYNLTLTYMFVRRFADAIAMADHILAIEPSNREANSLKADSLWAMGNVKAVESLVPNPSTGLQLRAQQLFLCAVTPRRQIFCRKRRIMG